MDTRKESNNIEFLDVFHYADQSYKVGFKIQNFIKPTGVDAFFFNAKSHHPLHIFRGIILSEARRLRMLNEDDKDYCNSLEKLKKEMYKFLIFEKPSGEKHKDRFIMEKKNNQQTRQK